MCRRGRGGLRGAEETVVLGLAEAGSCIFRLSRVHLGGGNCASQSAAAAVSPLVFSREGGSGTEDNKRVASPTESEDEGVEDATRIGLWAVTARG